MNKGVPVSPGVAVARAYRMDHVLAKRAPHQLDEAVLSDELLRFDAAVRAAAEELDAIVKRVTEQVGEEEAAIFRAHRLLLRDPNLIGKVKSAILSRHVDAVTALQDVVNDYNTLLSQIPDQYIRERMADIRDVAGRVLAQLSLHEGRQKIDVDEPVIIVAPEILPSQALAFDRLQVGGILTETGGSTGHAAILARSLGIPAVSGLRGILKEIKTGDLLAMDGREGLVYINPGAEVEAMFRKLQREYVDLRNQLIENRDQEAVSADGEPVELLANVNGPADAQMAVQCGAVGVGLYRTEYLFLTHPTVPTEEEQLTAYRQVIEAAPNHTVTIRTLDLGGDKNVPYLGNSREANPFMGWRSIRLSAAYPEFFQMQLRAILRAGLSGQINLLFPMISTLEEVQRLKKVVQRTRASLRRSGIPCADKVPLGIMVEVPAAAVCIKTLLPEVDFVSIGSNDLIQYLMAADRDNPKVAHLCEPFAPANLHLLSHVISACNAQGKPVTLCGEMAGRPRCFLPLFGMGLRRLSMSPGFIPSIKELVRRSKVRDCQQIAKRALQMKTMGAVRGYLTRKTQQVCPNVAFLDVQQ